MTEQARIVVGVNHSPAAEAALRWAIAKADSTGCAVTAVHVFDVSERSDLAMERDPQHEEVEAHHRAQTHVSEIVAESGTHVPVVYQTARGPLEATLLSAARSSTALVIGKPQRDRHHHLVHQLALSSSCPVVAVSEGGNAIAVDLPHQGSSPGRQHSDWSLDEAADLGV